MSTQTRGRILLAGETWFSYGVHQKGFSAYTTGGYEEGQTEFVRALEDDGWLVRHIPNHLATEEFPWTAEELAEYSLVILSDIPADTLHLHPATFVRGERRPDRLAEIATYVERGGGFLMVGGYMSFSGFEGKARYHGTAIESLLPISLLGYDDRVEAPQGVTPVVSMPEHPAVADLPQEWPYFLGYNRFTATGGDVVLSVGDDPFLVLDEHGKGRTAAFASDCSPHWGSPEFMAWDGYGRLWSSLAAWLTSGDGSRARA
jgi:uncharacterized membrane protein